MKNNFFFYWEPRLLKKKAARQPCCPSRHSYDFPPSRLMQADRNKLIIPRLISFLTESSLHYFPWRVLWSRHSYTLFVTLTLQWSLIIDYSSGAQRGCYRTLLGGEQVLRDSDVILASRGAVSLFWAIRGIDASIIFIRWNEFVPIMI